MKHNKKHNKGVTLLELIIVIGIMGLIITAIFSFFISSLKTFNRADDHIQAQNNAQAAMNRIVDDIIGGEIVLVTANSVICKMNNKRVIKYEDEKDNENLKRGEGTSETDLTTDDEIEKFANEIGTDSFANHITEFDIVASGNQISISITSKINDAEVKLKNEIYLRNGKK